MSWNILKFKGRYQAEKKPDRASQYFNIIFYEYKCESKNIGEIGLKLEGLEDENEGTKMKKGSWETISTRFAPGNT